MSGHGALPSSRVGQSSWIAEEGGARAPTSLPPPHRGIHTCFRKDRRPPECSSAASTIPYGVEKALGDDPAKLSTYDRFPSYPTAEDASVISYCQTVNSQLTLHRGRK